ncbi:hypothetical protein RCL1_008248 [Eukaryota sp. TZLM3-RCL]
MHFEIFLYQNKDPQFYYDSFTMKRHVPLAVAEIIKKVPERILHLSDMLNYDLYTPDQWMPSTSHLVNVQTNERKDVLLNETLAQHFTPIELTSPVRALYKRTVDSKDIYTVIIIQKDLSSRRLLSPNEDATQWPAISSVSSLRGSEYTTAMIEAGFDFSGVPPSILFEPFAQFIQQTTEVDDSPLKSNEIEQHVIDTYFQVVSCCNTRFISETEFRHQLALSLHKLTTTIKAEVSQEHAFIDISFEIDPALRGAVHGVNWPIAVIEVKTTSNKGDESLQGILCWANRVKDSVLERLKCPFPCLVVGLRGTVLSFFACLSQERFLCEFITTVNLTVLGSDTNGLYRNLRIFNLFYQCIKALSNHYNTRLEQSKPLFPWFNVLLNNSLTGEAILTNSQLQYVARLKRNVFLAKIVPDLISSIQQNVVVKFYRNYCQEAHQILSNEGLAPQLYYVGRAYCWVVVVEEYLSSPWCRAADAGKFVKLFPWVVPAASRAIELLSEQKFVHGDFRPTNWFINAQTHEVRIIDFEFSGREEVTTYPCLLNPDVSWHPEVGTGKVLKQVHDRHFLTEVERGNELTQSPSKVPPPKRPEGPAFRSRRASGRADRTKTSTDDSVEED